MTENELDLVEEELGMEEGRLAVLRLRMQALNDKISKLKARQVELCPHQETKDDATYFSGSYYDRASTMHRLKCTRCGKTVKSWEETHSWYG